MQSTCVKYPSKTSSLCWTNHHRCTWNCLKKAKATGDLIGNKVINKITKVSRNSPQNSLERVTSEAEHIGLDREIPKEVYISPEKRLRWR